MEKKFIFLNRDYTLIKSTSGSFFPKNADDWEFLTNVKKTIELMIDNDFQIGITTNQPGIARGTTTIEIQEEICKNIISSFDEKYHQRFHYFIADDPENLKPNKSVFENIIKDEKIDLFNSMVVGDTKADEIFAKNINLQFKPANKFFKNSQQITIMVGFPASGKTAHYREYNPFDVRVCLDDFITSINEDYKIEWKNIYYNIEEKIMTDALADKLDIIIDRTNVNKKRRKRFMDIINKYKTQKEEHTKKPEDIRIVCKHLKIPLETCKDNYTISKVIPENKLWEVEDIFDRMESEFEEPTLDEGFDEVITILPEDTGYFL